MLPITRAMPSAGRTEWNTSCSGMCTTKTHSDVRVRTLTRTLTPKPKNAFVSPRTHHGRDSDEDSGLAFRVNRDMAGSRGSERVDEHSGRCDPAEDPALGGDHLQADPLELREVRAH